MEELKDYMKEIKIYHFTYKGEEFTVKTNSYSESWLLAKVHIGLTIHSHSPDELMMRPFLTEYTGLYID